jgi:hypothetical protein
LGKEKGGQKFLQIKSPKFSENGIQEQQVQ